MGNDTLWNDTLWNDTLWNDTLWNKTLWSNTNVHDTLWNSTLGNDSLVNDTPWNNTLWNNTLWNNTLVDDFLEDDTFGDNALGQDALWRETPVTNNPWDTLTIFHKINMFSQCLNWIITFLYFFASSLVSKMKGVIEMDAMKYNDRQQLRELQKKYAELVHSVASRTYRRDLDIFRARLDHLILETANCQNVLKEHFASFDTDWKFHVLQQLFVKKVARFAKA